MKARLIENIQFQRTGDSKRSLNVGMQSQLTLEDFSAWHDVMQEVEDYRAHGSIGMDYEDLIELVIKEQYPEVYAGKEDIIKYLNSLEAEGKIERVDSFESKYLDEYSPDIRDYMKRNANKKYIYNVDPDYGWHDIMASSIRFPQLESRMMNIPMPKTKSWGAKGYVK